MWKAPKDELPDAAEVTLRLADFCTRWPETLLEVSKERVFSNELIASDFLWPIEAHVGVVGNKEIALILTKALEGFYAADIPKARSFCKLALEKLSGLSSLENPSYVLQ